MRVVGHGTDRGREAGQADTHTRKHRAPQQARGAHAGRPSDLKLLRSAFTWAPLRILVVVVSGRRTPSQRRVSAWCWALPEAGGLPPQGGLC